MAHLDLEHFLIKVWGGGGGEGCVKSHTWTKNAGNFMKWNDKSTKIYFHCLAYLDLENSHVKVWDGGEGVVWKITPETKLQEISWNG